MKRDNFLIQQHGLHRVDYLDTQPICHSCKETCLTPQACMTPEPEAAKPVKSDAWACVIGGALGLAGAAYITAHVLGRLQIISF